MTLEDCENVRDLKPSATLAVAALCNEMREQGRSVIDLSIGEPDFRTPDFAAQAGIAAIVQGFTHYTAVPGLPPLRSAIARHLSARAGRELSPAGVVVSNGAKQALFNAIFSLFGPGDEVLLPTPYWTSYPSLISLARAVTTFVPTRLEHDFLPTVDELEAAATPRTRGLILNSPANPTGATLSADALRAIVEWAAARGLWVISDEIYSRICYTAERAPGVLDLDPALLERVVLVDGVSKAFAMTGWRIGFAWSGNALAGRMAALQSHITSNAATPSQYAALAAFRDEPRVEHAVRAMVAVFRHRRARVIEALRTELPESRFVEPAGAFYVFLSVDPYFDDTRADAVAFCRWLLAETNVALVPGEAFGDERYVRLSFAAPQGELVEGVRRMAEAVRAPRAGLATR
jgi:aspartate aminotransferase